MELFEQYGIRNSHVTRSEFDHTFYSWHAVDQLQPACGWSKDLNLQWLAFSTGPQHWIVLDADGLNEVDDHGSVGGLEGRDDLEHQRRGL